MKRLKTALYMIGVLVLGFGLYSFSTNAFSERMSKSQSEWENLKILPQNISKDSLTSIMEGFNASLGVKCSYCHMPREDRPDRLNFPDDGKMAKLIARGMMEMTTEINEHYFRPHYPDPKPEVVYDVSCVTCHRGNPNPKKYLEGVGSLFNKEKTEKK